MSNEFNIYTAHDVRKLIHKTDCNEDEFKLKRLNKKSSNIFMFTNKDFELFTEFNDAQIVGNIRYCQRHYKDYMADDLAREKNKKNIIGQLNLTADKDDIVKYDVRKPKAYHAIGYVWLGNDKFLRVTSINPFFIFIPIFLAGIIALLFSSCPKDDTMLPWAQQSEITESDNDNNNTSADPLCYFVPYPEKIVLSEDSRTISLKNVSENTGNYYISYEVLIDGERIKLRSVKESENADNAYITGLINPGEEIELDLWSKLDEGTYKLTCRATEYGFENKDKKDISYNLTSYLVIEK